MQVLRTIPITQKMMTLTLEKGKSVGFVPTMGALHDGHMSLVEASLSECDYTVVSIFVNPTQFLLGEDFSDYPRDLEADKLKLERAGVDYLFLPDEKEIYPDEEMIEFKLPESYAGIMCGKSRPGHFEGVAQVCAKLFNIIRPGKVYFGQKDYLQTLVIQKLIEDLNFGIEMRVLPTVREKGGLAMSSRNKYLTDEERVAAQVLYKALKAGDKSLIEAEPMVELEYFERNGDVLAVAAKVGGVRLVDCVRLGREK
ncbi:MAG: pantoate--beta-alanine ligase [Patescibacteria group bacterium]|nr:pantoate--beta-alanine ligase [Patescibacteria group bacterium]